MAGHFFKKWPHRVVLGGGPWGNRPSGGAGFGGGPAREGLLGSIFGGLPGGVLFWGPRRGGGLGTLVLGFLAVLGYF